jgi:molecular chaperone GrpE (heat shock protein)
MDNTRLRHLAGLPDQTDESFRILETVEFGTDPTIEDVMRMMDAAKRALSIAHRLPDPAQKRKHFSKILTGMNKIRAYLQNMAREQSSVMTPSS